MGKILVLGAGGQICRALEKLLRDGGIFLSRKQLDLNDVGSIQAKLSNYQFDFLINAAAYTKVDDAEDNSQLCYDVNSNSLLEIAKFCSANNIPLVHYSTDYVFDGAKDGYYHEDDIANPLSVYGKSKLMGEEYIKKSGCKYLIFRTSWIYDALGQNFLNTMLRLGAQKDELKIVSDQYGAPTYAGDIAAMSLLALKNAHNLAKFPSGIYHLTNAGATSWYEFAKYIFEIFNPDKKPRLIPISTDQYPTKAIRPKNSRLSNDKIRQVLGVEMRNWQDGILEIRGLS